MKSLLMDLFLLFLLQLTFFEYAIAKKECIARHIPNADIVCVCNTTYCDDFPSLQKSKSGFVNVYESNKAGARFKESSLKFGETQTSNASKTQTVIINSTQTYQTILGVGGAFTDSAGQMLKSLPETMAQMLIESYFSTNGLEYSMGRIPIAGSDYSPRHYSYDDNDGDVNLTHFELQKEDIDYKIPFIKMAQKLSPYKLKLFGSPWVAPDWIKTNDTFNKIKGEIGGEYYQIWANYFVKFLDSYAKNGVDIWGITVHNEPTLGRKYPRLSLNWDPMTERDFIKLNLGPTLYKAGYNADKLKLMIFDDNVHQLQQWSDTILDDSDAVKYVSGVALHWYGNSRTTGYPDTLLDSVHQKHQNTFLLSTEACHLEGVGNGRWDFGEAYAHDIIRDLNHWVTGWIDWNLFLNTEGLPKWNDNKGFSSPVYIDTKAKEAYKQSTFYVLGHFSKFIPPDSHRIGHKLEKNIDKLYVLTIKRPDNATVLIAANMNNEEIDLKIIDSENHLSHTLSPHSIQSYIWW